MNINKKEFISKIATMGELKKIEVEKVLKAFEQVVIDICKNGDKVQLMGFGTFEGVTKAEAKKRNPKTGEEIIVPEHIAPKFKFSSNVKKEVKGNQ